jgi:O-acetyl-ADP-ribose deacetylase (regulator of RNase III)
MPTYKVAPDLFETDADILVNTTNCVGVMGGGVALLFRERYPEMYQVYRHRCSKGLLKPGGLDVHMYGGKVIVNFNTKNHWKDPSEYAWIRQGLQAIKNRFFVSPLHSMAMPIPGAGLGGLEQEMVLYMIGEAFVTLPENKVIYIPVLPPQVRPVEK